MSRNLMRTNCAICRQGVVLSGVIHLITPDECGVYFDEYKGMYVADALCLTCNAKYLAWVRYNRRSMVPADDLSVPFEDLSFRSTFNDEPGPDDLPTPEVLSIVHLQRTIEIIKAKYEQVTNLVMATIAEIAESVSLESHWERYRRLT